MFKRICKYEAMCDSCGKRLEITGNTVKVAARNLKQYNGWSCIFVSNPDNIDNDPCKDYNIYCPNCGKEIKK